MKHEHYVNIFAPYGFHHAKFFSGYPYFFAKKPEVIANILHLDNPLEALIFSQARTNMKYSDLIGLVLMNPDPLIHYTSESLKLLNRKELKNKSIILDKNEDSSIFKRIAHAYKIGAPQDIIAKAEINKDFKGNNWLYVTACDFNAFKINVKAITALASLSENELKAFKIHEFGFYLHWPKQDIHLNIDSLAIIASPKLLNQKLSALAKDCKSFGLLMKQFRNANSQFSQKDFSPINERQIRKYENGEAYPTYKNLTIIASKYQLSVNDYLNKLLV